MTNYYRPMTTKEDQPRIFHYKDMAFNESGNMNILNPDKRLTMQISGTKKLSMNKNLSTDGNKVGVHALNRKQSLLSGGLLFSKTDGESEVAVKQAPQATFTLPDGGKARQKILDQQKEQKKQNELKRRQ